MHVYYPFTEALIRTMAKQQLAAAQWPDDLELRYSLNACQGDGVSFTGTLSTADLLRLLPVLQARGLLSDDVTSTLQLFIPLLCNWSAAVSVTAIPGRLSWLPGIFRRAWR
ncbi:hypothetical protein KX75_20345 [Salmonella enterica subsp. enterica]|nr:hypothetical protein [Salmonella enterica subsp. enterica serovar Mikawasima]EDN7229223.1 hypothetical protein [Salmonella enterica subsp. enterica serovar Mikawasima]